MVASKSKGYVFGGAYFRTKEAVVSRLRSVLYGYRSGKLVSAEDHQFLLSVLEEHPHKEEKIGTGVAGFRVRVNPVFAHRRTFYIVRVDGTEEDFSFMKCLYPCDNMKLFKSACRLLVGEDILAFKEEFFRERGEFAECPFTGELMVFSDSHVDHIPPRTFDNLIAQFIEKYKINVDEVEFCPSKHGVGQTLASDELAARWIVYHRRRARLRVVSPFANLSIIKGLSKAG